MKTIIIAGALCLVLLTACGSSKHVQTIQTTQTPDIVRTPKISLEGENVVQETIKMHGMEMADALSDDGTQLIKIAYKWYAGIGKADNKQVAIELAQREAYATISRILNNAVKDNAERGNVVNNGKVQQALTSHWEQISMSLMKGAEPFGDVVVEYSPSTQMYNATAKVGMRGDVYTKVINNAGNFKPSDLNEDELNQFIDINRSIMEAAR